MKTGMALLAGMLATVPEKDRPVVISSYKIETKKEEQQLSKCKMQRMKGKKARKNRGNNR